MMNIDMNLMMAGGTIDSRVDKTPNKNKPFDGFDGQFGDLSNLPFSPHNPSGILENQRGVKGIKMLHQKNILNV